MSQQLCLLKGDGFLLFLKAFFWETDLWITFGDFALTYAQLRRVICYCFDRNEICCAEESHSYMSNLCGKQFSDSNFWQNKDFSRNCPKIHILTRSLFLKTYWAMIDQMHLHVPINIMAVAWEENSFSIFASWEPLKAW